MVMMIVVKMVMIVLSMIYDSGLSDDASCDEDNDAGGNVVDDSGVDD
jgi:hypothetical protein